MPRAANIFGCDEGIVQRELNVPCLPVILGRSDKSSAGPSGTMRPDPVLKPGRVLYFGRVFSRACELCGRGQQDERGATWCVETHCPVGLRRELERKRRAAGRLAPRRMD